MPALRKSSESPLPALARTSPPALTSLLQGFAVHSSAESAKYPSSES